MYFKNFFFIAFTLYNKTTKLVVEKLMSLKTIFVESIEECSVEEMQILEGRTRLTYSAQNQGGFVILAYKCELC